MAPGRHWTVLRALVLSYALVCASATGDAHADTLVDLPWAQVLVIAALGAALAPLTLFLPIAAQRFNPMTADVWEWPAWDRMPFSPRQPIVALHFATQVALAAVLGVAVRTLWAGGSWHLPVVLLATGASAGASMWAMPVLFPGKMRRSTPDGTVRVPGDGSTPSASRDALAQLQEARVTAVVSALVDHLGSGAYARVVRDTDWLDESSTEREPVNVVRVDGTIVWRGGWCRDTADAARETVVWRERLERACPSEVAAALPAFTPA